MKIDIIINATYIVIIAALVGNRNSFEVPTFISPINLLPLPTPAAFVAELFNTTVSEIMTVAYYFTYQDVDVEDIKLKYFPYSGEPVMLPIQNCCTTIAFEKNSPMKIIIHGWTSSADANFVEQMAVSYHKRGRYTVFGIDWSLHSQKNYVYAASAVKHIGQIVGDFILNLVRDDCSLLDNVHIIGHSLGAHTAGFIGKRISEQTDYKIGRITGLDPAGPLFEFPIMQDEGSRLNAYDAQFVDVLHTNIAFCGFVQSIGMADFYIEYGGPIQPGCVALFNAISSIICSHTKATEYFIESIVIKQFKAVQCENSVQYQMFQCDSNEKQLMGEDTSSTACGIYYLTRNSSSAPRLITIIDY